MDFKRIQVERGYEALASAIRQQILTGEIPVGYALPNERALGDKTGLSRNSVREALRVLEAQGLVSTTLGRYGGRTTLAPGPELLETSVDFLIKGNRLPFTGLLETIELLEPSLAELAATRRTVKDLARIADLTQQLEEAKQPSEFHDVNAEWHIAVASASGNLILTSLLGVLGRRLHNPHVEDFASAEIRDQVLRAHSRIESAIVEGDAAAARRRMARHVVAYGKVVQPIAPEVVEF